CVQVMTFPLTF
nr:immunoglobulin light chain junction region [Macaca mulatta]